MGSASFCSVIFPLKPQMKLFQETLTHERVKPALVQRESAVRNLVSPSE